jgi:hypothetical protein
MSDGAAGEPMTPDEFARHDGMGLAGLVRRREVSATEALEAAIAAVEAGNPVINAVVCRLYDQARAAIAARLPAGPFTGVPYLLEDLGAHYQGAVTSGGGALFEDFAQPWVDRRSPAAGAWPRSGGREGFRELVVAADPAVGAEHEEVEAARGYRTAPRRPHLPAEGHRVVVAGPRVGGPEDVALGAHEAVVGPGDAGLDRLVPARLEGRGEVGAVLRPQRRDGLPAPGRVGLVPDRHVPADEILDGSHGVGPSWTNRSTPPGRACRLPRR